MILFKFCPLFVSLFVFYEPLTCNQSVLVFDTACFFKFDLGLESNSGLGPFFPCLPRDVLPFLGTSIGAFCAFLDFASAVDARISSTDFLFCSFDAGTVTPQLTNHTTQHALKPTKPQISPRSPPFQMRLPEYPTDPCPHHFSGE